MNEGLTKLQEEKLIILAKKYNLKLLILFGSRAKGNHKNDSDYDFAFENFKGKLSSNKYIKLHEDLMNLFNYEKIDLIDIKNTKKLYVLKNIFLTGKLIYESKSGLFDNLKWSCWIDYQDFKHYYDKSFQITKNKLIEI